MTRLQLIDLARICAARFGPCSHAGLFLKVLQGCFPSDVAREAATLIAYWTADPDLIDGLLCGGEADEATQPGNAANVARAFTWLSQCLPLPGDPTSQLIRALLIGPQQIKSPGAH